MQKPHNAGAMDITLFNDLARLEQTGNFSQAAELGHISQPAFSRRIKALEAWVGVELVDRRRQPVKLTPAGNQMLEAGLQALIRIEQERSQILEAQSLPDKYVVNFAAQHSIGWRFYPNWLQGFEEAYGPILSRLRADDLPLCMTALERGEVDFAIAYARADDRGQGSDSIVIGKDCLVLVCKPGRDGQPLFRFDAKDIRMPFLRFGDAAPIGKHLDPVLRHHGLDDRLQTVYENSMAGALRIRARGGDGVAWLPETLVAPDLEAGILVRTGQPEWSVPLDIRMYRNPARSNRLTRAIWSFLDVRQSVVLAT